MKPLLFAPLACLCTSAVMAVEGPTFHIAPVEVTVQREGVWSLQDRLLEEFDLFLVSPSYSVTHRRFRDTSQSESDLLMVDFSLSRLRPWSEADLDGAQVHFVWLREGRIEWVHEVDAVGKFHASGAYAALAVRTLEGGQQLEGSPAVLVSKGGEFIPPRAWFGGNVLANRVAFKIAAGIQAGLAEDIAALPDPDVQSALFQGGTLAHIAAEAGNIPALVALADAGANLDVENSNRFTPLWWAVDKNRVAAVEWLLDRGVRARSNLDGEHLIEVAVNQGHIEAAAAIYRRQSSTVWRDEMLGGAAFAGNRELSRELLADYSDFGLRWIDAEPLWWVAQSGDVDLMRLMLDRGVSARRHPHSVPMLSLAARAGDPAMVELLIERGARLNARDPRGRTALIEATFGGHADVAAALLKLGAELGREDKEGLSALDYAELRHDARLLAVLTGEGDEEALRAADEKVFAEWQVDSRPRLRQRPEFRLMREDDLALQENYRAQVLVSNPLALGGGQVLGESPSINFSHSIVSAESTEHFAYWTGIVETDGTLSHARVLSAGPARFRTQVERAMGDYRFEPARRNGEAVRTRVVWLEDLR